MGIGGLRDQLLDMGPKQLIDRAVGLLLPHSAGEVKPSAQRQAFDPIGIPIPLTLK